MPRPVDRRRVAQAGVAADDVPAALSRLIGGDIQGSSGPAGGRFVQRHVAVDDGGQALAVIQLERLPDGRRRLTSLHELTGMEGDVITMQEIFAFKRVGIDSEGNIKGEFRSTGVRPKFMESFEARGIEISPDIFSPDKLLG